MDTKDKAIIAVVALSIAFASGRYYVDAPEVKTKEILQQVDHTETDKDSHTQTIIVATQEPSGAKKTVTTITKDVVTTAKESRQTDTEIVQDVIPPKKNSLTISAFAGTDFRSPGIIYGAAVSKELLGPVSVGVWGLTTGVVGLSIGLSF